MPPNNILPSGSIVTEMFSETCSCNRTFSSPGAFKNHQNSCSTRKNLLSYALETLKAARLKRVREPSPPPPEHTSDEDLEGQNSMAFMANKNGGGSDKPPPKRRRVLPKRFRSSGLTMHDKKLADILPQPVIALPPPQEPQADTFNVDLLQVQIIDDDLTLSHDTFHIDTAKNAFGMFRRYHHRTSLPTHDPERHCSLQELSNIPLQQTSSLSTPSPTSHDSVSEDASESAASLFHPFPNKSSLLLGDWFWNGGLQKSQRSFKQLLAILKDDSFSLDEIRTTNWNRINHDLEYMLSDFYHRSLVSIIEDKLRRSHNNFHYEPFDLLWHSPSAAEPIQLYGECYTSSSFKDAHQELQRSPREPGCNLPRVVVALMFWSDATLLTNFGNAKLWPLYMCFGNESKYQRCKPSCNLFEHVAYFECIPDKFKDFATVYYGKKRKMNREFLAHCHREAIHAQWKVLLDDEFIHAFVHGIVIECPDGMKRRFYPRIFTYSADYPEKALMATTRQKGRLPCPRCKVPMSTVHLVGTKKDRKDRKRLKRVDDLQRRGLVNSTRESIYESNYAADSAHVKRQMGPHSLVPTANAFSERLFEFGFNLFLMFVVDLMHEIESGVWKSLLLHLFRILISVDVNLLHELDRRFRQTPTFGRDTIRKFSRNVSELKQMAAWNYEDFLQCAIPVFDGLLPEPHNSQILQLLFHFAFWHGMAKLRLHSELTLAILDKETTILPEKLREFQSDTCLAFNAKELPREAAARNRRKATRSQKVQNPAPPSASVSSGKGKPQRQKDIKANHTWDHGPTDTTRNGPPSASSSQQDTSGRCSDVGQAPKGATRQTAHKSLRIALQSNSACDDSDDTENAGEHDSRQKVHAGDELSEAHSSQSETSAGSVNTKEHDPLLIGGEEHSTSTSGRRTKKFNLNTYKTHAIGDYVEAIKMYGTTDSYSTEPGELEHRTPKSRYKRTSRRAFTMQLAQSERRQARLRHLKSKATTAQKELELDTEFVPDEPALHHHIGATENFPCHIGTFLHENSGDPATRDFLPSLRAHLASRLLDALRVTRSSEANIQGMANEPQEADVDPNLMYIKRDTMFQHNIARINYTTYDIRRAQDIINPKTDHRDIMLLENDDHASHQYRYARVLGIFHVNVIYAGYIFGKRSYEAHRMEFLFVDRDMVMRYHWGLGIGHIYSWKTATTYPLSILTTYDQDEDMGINPESSETHLTATSSNLLAPDETQEEEGDQQDDDGASEGKDDDDSDSDGHRSDVSDSESEELPISTYD
ncbi:hypothetical protein Hypma_003008 [Hypsizygus marmoreus]|uniref:Uncharacterized protein n=1 Tax=Hypsizygus marmoreus TaxID=39966 RepID=A0A369J2L8_HYPMA|nr:hypothetical protein Hypma_003008 [Hypsizygus marmoreus]